MDHTVSNIRQVALEFATRQNEKPDEVIARAEKYFGFLTETKSGVTKAA